LTVVGSTLTEIADSLRRFVAGEPMPTLSVGQTALPECPNYAVWFLGCVFQRVVKKFLVFCQLCDLDQHFCRIFLAIVGTVARIGIMCVVRRSCGDRKRACNTEKPTLS